jgi:hypothetical protein
MADPLLRDDSQTVDIVKLKQGPACVLASWFTPITSLLVSHLRNTIVIIYIYHVAYIICMRTRHPLIQHPRLAMSTKG